MSTGRPTEAERDAAAWRLVNAQIRLAERQGRWEIPKALAMTTLAIAAVVAATHLIDVWAPHQPQTINVHLDQPLVKGQ